MPETVSAGPADRGVAYRVSAFEGPSEHASICGGDAHVLVQERSEVLAGLILVHCDAKPGMGGLYAVDAVADGG